VAPQTLIGRFGRLLRFVIGDPIEHTHARFGLLLRFVIGDPIGHVHAPPHQIKTRGADHRTDDLLLDSEMVEEIPDTCDSAWRRG